MPSCRVALPLLAVACLALVSCSSPAPVPAADPYSRPLPAGGTALRLITDPALLPDLPRAFASRDALVLEAMDQSLRWFDAPSSRQHFPFETITHERARQSLEVMREILQDASDGHTFAAEVIRRFDVYESVGHDGGGVVLYTGYFSPIFAASLERSDRFCVPLYRRPDDLMTDPVSGRPLGRRAADGAVGPYPTRREIEQSQMLSGSELVWLENELDAYLIHVNGSAKLRLDSGRVMYIGYAGKTDRPYASLGKAMVEAQLLRAGRMNLSAIREVHRRDAQAVRELMYRNENYVFFTEYPEGRWPSGSLGVRVTPETTLATDKSIYPRAGLVLVDTKAVTFTGRSRDFFRFMLDQDTGGAIDAPGRADIFMGIGPGAEILAGGQYAEGRLYYFFLKAGETESTALVER